MKRQNGSSTLNVILILAVLGFLVYSLILTPMDNRRTIDEIGSTRPVTSSSYAALVERHKDMSEPRSVLDGEYFGHTLFEGRDVTLRFHFGASNTVRKSLIINDKYTVTGTAKYQLEGSSLSYSDPQGHIALFSEVGEAITVHNDQSFTVYHDDWQSITMKSEALHQAEAAEILAAEQARVESLRQKSVFERSASESAELFLNGGAFALTTKIVLLPIAILGLIASITVRRKARHY